MLSPFGKAFHIYIKIFSPNMFKPKSYRCMETIFGFSLPTFVILNKNKQIIFIFCSINKNKRTYFYSGFIAYFLGLATTIFVMHVFKHAQVTFLAYLVWSTKKSYTIMLCPSCVAVLGVIIVVCVHLS